MKKSYVLVGVILLVLILDQALKIWVKTNMYIGEDSFLDWSWTPQWARIQFIENDGMAFGIEIWGPYGKLILSLFRIIAVAFLIYFIRKLMESKASMGLLISFSLILAGAIGNILDSAFYGLIFSASPHHGSGVATFLPEAGGYANFLHGKVVDMLYCPITAGYFPDWFPFWGGQRYEFFRPIFNIADVSISTGVISILLFQRSFFSGEMDAKPKEESIQEVKIEESKVAISDTENLSDEQASNNPTKSEEVIKPEETNLESNESTPNDASDLPS